MGKQPIKLNFFQTDVARLLYTYLYALTLENHTHYPLELTRRYIRLCEGISKPATHTASSVNCRASFE